MRVLRPRENEARARACHSVYCKEKQKTASSVQLNKKNNYTCFLCSWSLAQLEDNFSKNLDGRDFLRAQDSN